MAKGQVATVDLIASIGLFMLIFGTFLSIQDRTFEENSFYLAQKKAQEAGFVLLASKGNPENWNLSTVKLLGITSKPNVIDEEKISLLLNLTNSSYDQARQKLGLTQYEVFLNLTYANNTQFGLSNVFFNSSAFAGKSLESPVVQVTQKRLALLNGQEVFFHLTVAK